MHEKHRIKARTHAYELLHVSITHTLTLTLTHASIAPSDSTCTPGWDTSSKIRHMMTIKLMPLQPIDLCVTHTHAAVRTGASGGVRARTNGRNSGSLNSTESSEQNPSMSPMAHCTRPTHAHTRHTTTTLPLTFPCDDNFTDRLEKRQRSHQASADTAATCGAMAGQGGPTHASRDSLSFLSRALRRGVHLNAKVLRVPLTRDLTRSFYCVVLIFLSTPTLCCTGRGAQPPCMPPSTCIPSGLAAPASLAAHTSVV